MIDPPHTSTDITFQEFLLEQYKFIPYPEDHLLMGMNKMNLMRYASSMTQVPDMWGTELLAVRDYILFLEVQLGVIKSEDIQVGEDRRLAGVDGADMKTIDELFAGTRTIRVEDNDETIQDS